MCVYLTYRPALDAVVVLAREVVAMYGSCNDSESSTVQRVATMSVSHLTPFGIIETGWMRQKQPR